jgi:hypothetical protein
MWWPARLAHRPDPPRRDLREERAAALAAR